MYPGYKTLTLVTFRDSAKAKNFSNLQDFDLGRFLGLWPKLRGIQFSDVGNSFRHAHEKRKWFQLPVDGFSSALWQNDRKRMEFLMSQ